MASPVDAARVTGTTGASANTIVAVNTPSLAPAAGDLVIFFARTAGAPGTVSTNAPARPMTQLASDTSDASDDQTMVWYRLCTGAEIAGDFALTWVNAVKAVALAWKITGAADTATQLPEISTVAVGTTAANTANPASRAVTGGPKDVLYLAMCGYDGSGGIPTAAPTNYSTLITSTAGSGGAATQTSCGGASRQISASSSDDPGVFTHPAANSGWTAWTVVIHPFVAPSGPTVIPVGFAVGRDY